MSTESLNVIMGRFVESKIAEKYGASLSCSDDYDAGYENMLLEIKSSLSWHGRRKEGGRFSIEANAHMRLKEAADREGKEAVYVFVKIPRNKNGTFNKDPDTWSEVNILWKNVDLLIKSRMRPGGNYFSTSKKGVYYHRIPADIFFGA